MRRQFFVCSALIFAAVGSRAMAQSIEHSSPNPTLETQNQSAEALTETRLTSRFSFSAGLHYSAMSLQSTSFPGLLVELSGRYAFHKRWAIEAGLDQSLDYSNSFLSLYSVIRTGITYALSGRLLEEQRIYSSPSAHLTTQSAPLGGLRMGIFAKQYFLHSTASATPLFGPSISLSYDWMAENSRFIFQPKIQYTLAKSSRYSLSDYGAGLAVGYAAEGW